MRSTNKAVTATKRSRKRPMCRKGWRRIVFLEPSQMAQASNTPMWHREIDAFGEDIFTDHKLFDTCIKNRVVIMRQNAVTHYAQPVDVTDLDIRRAEDVPAAASVLPSSAVALDMTVEWTTAPEQQPSRVSGAANTAAYSNLPSRRPDGRTQTTVIADEILEWCSPGDQLIPILSSVRNVVVQGGMPTVMPRRPGMAADEVRGLSRLDQLLHDYAAEVRVPEHMISGNAWSATASPSRESTHIPALVRDEHGNGIDTMVSVALPRAGQYPVRAVTIRRHIVSGGFDWTSAGEETVVAEAGAYGSAAQLSRSGDARITMQAIRDMAAGISNTMRLDHRTIAALLFTLYDHTGSSISSTAMMSEHMAAGVGGASNQSNQQ